MVKQILPAVAVLIFLSSCTTFKPLNFASSKQVVSSPAPAASAKFIEDISVTPQAVNDKAANKPGPQMPVNSRGVNIDETPAAAQENKEIADLMALRNKASVESASSVQLKYSVLMNTEVENLPNRSLLEAVDEWYGVRYRKGGNTKKGIDCSGFTEAVYAVAYGIALPAVAREQYRVSRKISTTELQEGDLVFFNTTGGISHVGVYLGNNKFIHATVSRGVMVNGLFEPYYLKRYIGAGRIDDKQMVSASN